MKSYTDLSQSKKLAEFLPLESADMFYTSLNSDYPWVWIDKHLMEVDDIPCWSLAALLNTTCMVVGRVVDLDIWICASHKLNLSLYADNPIDAAFEMVCRLKENKKL